MTSRERILASLDHREPDRLPIDCGAMRSTGIQAIAYHRLKVHLNLWQGRTRVFDVVQQLAEPEPFYLDQFHVDAINAGREFAPDEWNEWTLPDGSACQIPAHIRLRREGHDWLAFNDTGEVVARMIEGCTYFNQTIHPLAREDWTTGLKDLGRQMNAVCWASLPEPMYADGLSDENLVRMGEHVRRLRERSNRAIMIAYGANLFEWGSYLRRMDNFLLDLVGEQASAVALLDKLVELHLEGLDRLLPAVGEHVDLIQLGDDLGMEAGPFFSPALFRKLFKPRYAAMVRHIKERCPRLRIFLHCCGSIRPLLPDLIEAGIEVINPVQIAARNMDPAVLKKDFGADLTFWGGGCDTQKVLPRGTPQEVKDHVRRNIDILAPGGGFVFCQVHNILADVPPENIVAMYEAAMA